MNFSRYQSVRIIRPAFLLFFAVLYLFSGAQNNQVVLTDWVKKPDAKELRKPLLFIDFWATWCVPCIHAMPQTELLKNEFGSDVLFVYVSDESDEKVKYFMNKFDKDFYSAIDNSGTNHANFKVTTLPYSVLLDVNGKKIWEGQPVDLKRNTLQGFVNRYKGHNGSESRINLLQNNYKEDNWHTLKSNGVSLQYMEKEFVSNTYSVDNDEHYFSGDIKYIISMVYNISMSNIISEVEVDKKYILQCKTSDDKDFRMILKKFLKNECSIDISKEKGMTEAYILKEGDVQKFLKADYHDFEKGSNSYLADDMNVMIDNSTIEEMTNILSNFSEYRFIYEGKIKDRYDWNIHYKFNNLTIEQLESELNFTIKKEKVEIEFLHLSYLDESY